MEYSYGNNQGQYSTTYGGQGGADGGGFVGGEPTSSQAGGKGGYGKDTIRPVTVKQVLEAQPTHADPDFKIDGEPITLITFVGQIRQINKQTTNTTYRVDDGTGQIEVKKYIDDMDTSAPDDMEMVNSNKPTLVQDGYCRVWGRLKSFGNKMHVGALAVRPITDFNEVHYALLDATAVHLLLTRGPPAGATTNGPNGATHAAQADQEIGPGGRPMPPMSAIARRLVKTLHDSPMSNEGLHAQMLASMMGVPVAEVYKASEEILPYGVIFTTVDDHTFAILDYN